MLYDIDALLGDTLVVKAGGAEHAVRRPTAMEEVAWARFVTALVRGKVDEDVMASGVALVDAWVPTLDAATLDGGTLVRLGNWIAGGGDDADADPNASGATESQETQQPSSPTSTD